jgi:precorrin-6B methylase 2
MTRRWRWLLSLVVLLALMGLVLYLASGVSREEEVERLAALLALRDGMTVAEIGAGSGWLTVEVARKVGPSGRVYSTELGEANVADIRSAVADAALGNVTVVEGDAGKTNLPPNCCDAIFMRRVYHHFSDAPAMVASLHESLKPGGQLAIIEFAHSSLFGRALGEGIDREPLVDEVTAGGFELVSADDWPGWGHYVARFRKRRALTPAPEVR